MTDRRRNFLVLLLVAGLLAASAVVIAVKPTLLGLELKGGVQLNYQAQPTAEAKVNEETLDHSIEIMRRRVDALGVAQPEIQRNGHDEIDVALPDVSNAQRAEEQVGKTAQLYFYDWETNVIGPDGKPAGPGEPSVTGGSQAGSASYGLPQYKAVLRAAKRPPIYHKKNTTQSPGCTLEKSAATGCIYGQWYLVDTKHERMLCAGDKAICPGQDTEKDLYADGYKPPADSTPKAVLVNPGTVVVQARPIENAEGKVIDGNPNSFYVLNDDPVITGEEIKNPQQSVESNGNGQPIVTFGFTSQGGAVFERVTRQIAERGQNALLPGVTKEQAQQHFAVVLDEQLITVPFIDFTANPTGIDASNGSQISGGFTLTSAQNLAQELQSGALPVKLALISNSQVSATLGKEALRQAVMAGLIGFILVCLFLVSFYRLLGLVAVGGLIVYGAYFFALIKLIPITLTLPGIAGIVITIGIAADANIVIFERVKEEIREGRSIVAGIATGYKRGFAAIVDANVVTFMTAFILFALATAEVKGFAFTLGLGTLVSLFTAVLATQAALGTMSRSRIVSSPAMLGAGKPKRKITFDFMGASRWFFTLSGIILLTGALAIGARGLNFGIDFKSGTRIQTGFSQPVSQSEVQSVLSKAGYGEAQIQKLTHNKEVGGNGFQITTKTLHPEQVRVVRSDLEQGFTHDGQTAVRNFSSVSIGPTFGKEVAESAVIAIIASLLVISVYIALRFEWKYAVPVLIALMHDLLITSGIYALTGREVTTATVAALLTILGYSLYDTIIVFDRVRENVPRMPRAAFSQIVNRSMSEVLVRSLATSFCTLLPVLSLLVLGGETLKSFAFALLVGIASGAYSSIFIASPVLTHWKEREHIYRNRRARIERELGTVPAYATSMGGAPADVEPAVPARSGRGSRATTLQEPGEQISKREFDELVADLDVEETAPQRDPAADLEPEEVVMPAQRGAPGQGRPRRDKQRRTRNRRHGRSH